MKIDWSRYYDGEVTMELLSDKVHMQAIFTLDNFGRAIKAIISDGGGVLTTNDFSYDSYGFIRTIKDSGYKGNEPTVAKFAYIDGGFSSICNL